MLEHFAYLFHAPITLSFIKEHFVFLGIALRFAKSIRLIRGFGHFMQQHWQPLGRLKLTFRQVNFGYDDWSITKKHSNLVNPNLRLMAKTSWSNCFIRWSE